MILYWTRWRFWGGTPHKFTRINARRDSNDCGLIQNIYRSRLRTGPPPMSLPGSRSSVPFLPEQQYRLPKHILASGSHADLSDDLTILEVERSNYHGLKALAKWKRKKINKLSIRLLALIWTGLNWFLLKLLSRLNDWNS